MNVRNIRKELNLSAAQVGEIIGVTERSIQRKEKGQRPFTGDELIKIRDFFQSVSGNPYTLDDLMGFSNPTVRKAA